MVLSSYKPLDTPILYIRDKTFFKYKNGIKIFLGSAFEIIRSYQKKYKLIHVIDENLLNGNSRNLDFYNHATYHTHIQLEIDKIDEHILKTLLEYDIRIVSKNIKLIDKVLSIKPNYAVLKTKTYEGNEKPRDLIVKEPNKNIQNKDENQISHRIFLYKKNYDSLPMQLKPYIFGVLF